MRYSYVVSQTYGRALRTLAIIARGCLKRVIRLGFGRLGVALLPGASFPRAYPWKKVFGRPGLSSACKKCSPTPRPLAGRGGVSARCRREPPHPGPLPQAGEGTRLTL